MSNQGPANITPEVFEKGLEYFNCPVNLFIDPDSYIIDYSQDKTKPTVFSKHAVNELIKHAENNWSAQLQRIYRKNEFLCPITRYPVSLEQARDAKDLLSTWLAAGKNAGISHPILVEHDALVRQGQAIIEKHIAGEATLQMKDWAILNDLGLPLATTVLEGNQASSEHPLNATSRQTEDFDLARAIEASLLSEAEAIQKREAQERDDLELAIRLSTLLNSEQLNNENTNTQNPAAQVNPSQAINNYFQQRVLTQLNSMNQPTASSNTTNHNQEDEDFSRAIALSLQVSQPINENNNTSSQSSQFMPSQATMNHFQQNVLTQINGNRQPAVLNNPSNHNQEDEDFARAIALSLQDVQPNSENTHTRNQGSQVVPSQAIIHHFQQRVLTQINGNRQPAVLNNPSNHNQEDEDFARAIALSLQDVQPNSESTNRRNQEFEDFARAIEPLNRRNYLR